MSAYTDSVESTLKQCAAASVGTCDSCEQCSESEGHNEFSASSCGICGTYMAGERHVWHWLCDKNELQHENDACTDCVMFMANGDEPESWTHI